MSPDEFRKHLFDVVQATTFESGKPFDDIIDAAGRLLAFAISRLPAAERETVLSDIEDGGLRRWVLRFAGARPAAYPRTTNGHAAH